LTDELARLARGDGRDRACIEDTQLGAFALIDDLMAAGRKSASHGFDLADVEAAADGIQSNSQFLI
jgi:hypothetical protein